MSKNNVRIAIRDSTDSHNVAFFDNKAGIKYKSANLQRFLAGSASILTLQYNSKDIDTIRTGCKLAFRYKARDYWLNIMKFEKQGFEVEITACSLHLELNNEERGAHKPDKAMSFAEYLAYYDPEHSVTLGINQVSDKRIKLEWTGTDTILARLFSIANSFDAELEFVTELNDDYSLKRHVLNVYKKGNLGSNKTSSPVRVGKELKVINYSDNIEDLRTAVRATGKDGLTIDGLNKKIYDDNKQLLYYSSGNTVYAPQSRDRFPSVGQASNDNWLVKDLGETEYETKEGLWGYMYGEIQKICLPKIEYKVTGAIDSDVGDTQTLIDDVHYEPPLYLKARVSELTDDILQGKVIDSTFINFERQYSRIADSLLKQVEALAEDAAPYIVRLSTDNGYNFKNGQGTSTITAKLEKYSKIVNANWKWLINNSIVSETLSVTINASQVIGTLNVVAVAIVDGNEVAREYITFTNSDDGVGIKSIKRYYTTNDQAEGVTAGGQNWSTKPTTVTADSKYMWSYDVITYTNDTSLVTEPAVIGARGDDGLDTDTTGITEALDKAKQELTALSANIEKVRDDSLAAVEEAKQQLTTVANDLNTAKQDLQAQASQLTAQASAQSELTKRVSSVEETANGTKTTVSELSKTVDSNTKNITSVTARTKTVEDDLTSTKTTLSQVKTTANSANQKTATLETGLNGLSARFSSLRVGGHNYLRGTSDQYQTLTSNNYILGYTGNKNISFLDLLEPLKGETVTIRSYIKNDTDFPVRIQIWFTGGGINGNPVPAHEEGYSVATGKILENFASCNVAFVQVGDGTKNGGTIQHKEDKLEKGNIATDYSPNEADIESKVAEYKQTADQNYASLQSNLQTLDGTVKSNKATADQTAEGFKTRIESFETYKDGESTRAKSYFEASKSETAKQLTAERIAIAKDYVAKSTYTSDVTGIKNDLSTIKTTADTTKTNLANYQASNDKAVANLQSNLQTANGNISSLQTKVEAVPGQITSAVSALDKSTVKSASLTINTDGIVMKAGKSTTDVANAIGSYFAVNQNAINLFSDKINVKANMIVNGAITSDKIAAGAINADKISASGITADKIKGGMLQSKTNTTKFDLDSGKLFYNSNNTGIFRIQNNASTMGLKFSNTNITVNGSSHILSRVILGGDRRETTLDDGKWDQGGFSGIVVETINGIAANEHDKADTVRVVADNIYFTHSYNKDVATNTSAAGWKMETFSPNSTYTGHIVMKPFGINYRYADIVTGDVRLDNGDGSGYWVRGCIQVLRNCFQHFLNGGTSNDAKNAIRNALKDISGV